MSCFREPQRLDFQRLNASIGFGPRAWRSSVPTPRCSRPRESSLPMIATRYMWRSTAATELRDERFRFEDDDEDIHMVIERRVTDVHSRAGRGGSARCERPDGRAARARRGAPRLADARLHAPAARPAGVSQPSSARLLLDARPRPLALRFRRASAAGCHSARARSRASISTPTGRDFILDYLGAAASCSTHLSRLELSWCCGRARRPASASSPTRGARAPR